MRNNLRHIAPAIAAYLVGLVIALPALTAVAGVNRWTGIGPVGNVAIGPAVVDPTASSTIYGILDDGVTKTTDGGAHWIDLGSIDSGVGVSGLWSTLLIDPASPSTLYTGTGFSFGGPSVYKSTDGGAHWAPASHRLPPSDVVALAIAPSQSQILYVGETFEGMFKSSDGAASWTRVNNGLSAGEIYNFSALAVDPTNANIVYVATAQTGNPDEKAKIFKSTNGAAQWRQVPMALPTGTSITFLAIDPATPSTIYAAYADYGDPRRGGVFKSSDSGETWTASQYLLPDTRVRALAIDPSSPSQIYAATREGVFRSTDAAASWAPINSGLPSLDVWSIAIDPTGLLLRATAAGLFEYQISGPPTSGTVPVIEYFYAAFGHYFITSTPDEISALDNGTFPGWVRTGFQFNAYTVPNENSAPVCRFFTTAFAPKSTHFYTPFLAECAIRRTDPQWLLESAAAFYIPVPAADGSCAPGLTPVYRLYNNGQGAAPNHRYTTDFTVRAQMIAQGWVPEGFGPNAVQMCSPP